MIRTKPQSYADGDTELAGEFFVDTNEPSGRRPGLMLVHGGAGLDDHARQQARRYAELGYVVLACDMFGRDIAGMRREQVIAFLTELLDDPDRLVRRARVGLDLLSRVKAIDDRTAVVGFCFGGLAALQLARSGAPLAAAISIHGSLAASARAEPGQVRARLLVCHGAMDPHVPLADVTAFAEEMNAAGADWQLNMYGGAQHGFTHTDAKPGAIPGVAYHEQADTLSFAATRDFLARAFGKTR
ncbi:MAG: dienelactone hydrolase family protein [Trebonia sp.]